MGWFTYGLVLPHYCLYGSPTVHSPSEMCCKFMFFECSWATTVVSWVLFTPQDLLSATGSHGWETPHNHSRTRNISWNMRRTIRFFVGFRVSMGFPSENSALVSAGFTTSRELSRQVTTGIWIGATSAFQQRLAQREQLATELSFLEGARLGIGEKWAVAARYLCWLMISSVILLSNIYIYIYIIEYYFGDQNNQRNPELNQPAQWMREGFWRLFKWVSPAKTCQNPMGRRISLVFNRKRRAGHSEC